MEFEQEDSVKFTGHLSLGDFMKSYLCTLLAILSVCLFCFNLYGQATEAKPTGCEENEARLDKVSLLVTNQRDSHQVLIIIARHGTGESSSVINRHRLHNAKEYILSRISSIPRDRIIVAEGEKTTGFGRVEFYFGGKMIDRLLVGKNKSLCVDCCENNRIPPFKYPQKDKAKVR